MAKGIIVLKEDIKEIEGVQEAVDKAAKILASQGLYWKGGLSDKPRPTQCWCGLDKHKGTCPK